MNTTSLVDEYGSSAARGTSLVFADGGASRLAPSNTLPAFELALEQGAPGLKVDVQLSADGIPVAFRGENLEDRSNGQGLVSSLAWDELSDLDAGAWFSFRFRGIRIPSLDDVLQNFGHQAVINLELHFSRSHQRRILSFISSGGTDRARSKMIDPLVHAVVRSIHFHRLAHRVVVGSSNPWALESLQQLDPQIRRAWIPASDHSRPGCPDGLPADAHEVFMTPRQVMECHASFRLGSQPLVQTGTISDPLLAQECAARGVGAILTDEVWKVVRALQVNSQRLKRA